MGDKKLRTFPMDIRTKMNAIVRQVFEFAYYDVPVSHYITETSWGMFRWKKEKDENSEKERENKIVTLGEKKRFYPLSSFFQLLNLFVFFTFFSCWIFLSFLLPLYSHFFLTILFFNLFLAFVHSLYLFLPLYYLFDF